MGVGTPSSGSPGPSSASTAMSAGGIAVRHRLAALAVVAGVVVVGAVAVLALVGDVRRMPVELALLAIAVVGAWFAVTRRGGYRVVAVLVGTAAAVGYLLVSFGPDPSQGFGPVLVRVGLLAAAVTLVAVAAGVDTGRLRRAATPGDPVPPATRGVLIINPRSGGGKAARFRLAEACRARGIEAVELGPGDDLVELAERAVTGGADVIGMAGGDGSQALVAEVSARRGVAMVVVPAGTRNHLALDLGLDRADVTGALDAYGAAVERTVDLAEVNGRVFVNNVSLGLYAAIIRSPEYRDAKIDTTLDALPDMLGRGSKPFDLRFTGPTGQPQERGVHVLQISNNPYGHAPGTWGNRPRLDTGRLGVIALQLDGDRSAAEFLLAAARGRPEQYDGLLSWEPTTFEVDSAGPIDLGLDGESIRLDPPLRFTVRPHALRVRLPEHAIGLSPAAREMRLRTAFRKLLSTAAGRPSSTHTNPGGQR